MTTMPVVLGAGPSNAKPRWNTLQILKASRVAIIALVALLLAAVIAGTTVHRDAMKTVGRDAAPSIISAQHIKSALADMDADAANDLLEPAAARDVTLQAYEARRVEAAKALILAAENITFGDAERGPIQTLELGMGSYEGLVQKARDLRISYNAGSVAAYRDAARLMDESLLPAADALDHANNDVLERTYRQQSSKSLAARASVGAAGFLVLLAMAMAQGFLSYRMKRTFNPLLLLATLLAAALTLYSLTAMGDEQHDLKVAKEDAFASIRALWRARAVAYQANAEEHRYLLDPANAAEYQRVFAAESNSLANLAGTMTTDQVLTTEANGHNVKGFTGLLADELNNITFNGERDAAVATLARFEGYLKTDAQMRSLEHGGQHKQAVDMCLGTGEGQSSGEFAQFDKALGTTLDINQSAFDEAVEKGFSALGSLEIKAAVVAAVIAVLVFLGLAKGIREYQ